MKARCVNNTGSILRSYELEHISNESAFGRFGVSETTVYPIDVGREYLVMGLIVFQSYVAYLVDDDGYICACPCQLFEIVDDRVNLSWRFRVVEKNEEIYPFVQAILGYPELCSDLKSYQKLIFDEEQEAQQIYFVRKTEILRELAE